MASPEAASEPWDETLCNTLACQHPPCWEALRRIESGHPRIVFGTPGPPRKQSPDEMGELPTLKIVDLPLNYSPRERIECCGSFSSISKSISSMKDARNYFSKCTQNATLIPPDSVVSPEKYPFFRLNSQIDSHTLRYSPTSYTRWRQPEKIQVTDISAFAVHRWAFQPPCGNLVVRWIPSTLRPQKPVARVVAPLRRISVKDLTLESCVSLKENPERKRKKSNKVPTGGQPYLLHLRRNKQVPADKSSPVGKGEDTKKTTLQKRHSSSDDLQLASIVPSQDKGNPKTESRRGALLESKKRGTHSVLLVPKAPSLYRFETKITMKEDRSRRIRQQLRVPSGGSVSKWHPTASLVKQLDSAENAGHRRGGGKGGRGSDGDQLVKAAQPFQIVSLGGCGPSVPPVAHPRKEPLLKFAGCKSMTAQLLTAECGNFFPRILRTESTSNQSSKQLTRQTDAPLWDLSPAPLNRRQSEQSTDAPQGILGETLPQPSSPTPRPPPPSPFSPPLREQQDRKLNGSAVLEATVFPRSDGFLF